VPGKIKAIVDMAEPKNVGQLRSFLGMVSYYGSFLPEMQNLRGPLDELTKKGIDWKWTEKQTKAFQKLKEVLGSELNLTNFDPSLPIVVSADASGYGIGAVISHRMPNGTVKPIAHASKVLNSCQKNYAQIEKEALALVFAVTKFHKFLFGRKFLLETDHKPLLAVFGNKKGIPLHSANRLTRWATIFLAYDSTIEYVNTDDFGRADALSRLMQEHPSEEEDVVVALMTSVEDECEEFFVNSVRHLPLTSNDIRAETHHDPVLKLVKSYLLSGWPESCEHDDVRAFQKFKNSLSIVSECLMLNHRVVIPTSLRKVVLKQLHSGHPGIQRMKRLAYDYVYWPGIDKDCDMTVRSCDACQKAGKNPVKEVPIAWPEATAPWERLHIDYAGPMNGYYCFVAVDAFSKWPEMVLTKSTTASRTVEMLEEMFSRFGLPKLIVSDNGTQFASALFAEFCESKGIKHIRTAPYHPQSNGQAERFVDILKRGLLKLKGEEKELNPNVVNQVLFSYRSTPSAALSFKTPAELFLSRKLRSVLDLLIPNSRQTTKRQVEIRKNYAIGDSVYARCYEGNSAYWLPGHIVKLRGHVN
jgi:hypothetical protein